MIAGGPTPPPTAESPEAEGIDTSGDGITTALRDEVDDDNVIMIIMMMMVM